MISEQNYMYMYLISACNDFCLVNGHHLLCIYILIILLSIGDYGSEQQLPLVGITEVKQQVGIAVLAGMCILTVDIYG